LDCDEDELPPLPGELADAVDELFEGLDDLHRLEDAAVRELLWRVLERVGRLEHFCLEEAGMSGRTVEEARDSEEREWLLEQERNFVGYCSRELDAIAQAAIDFAVALWIQCSPRLGRALAERGRGEDRACLGVGDRCGATGPAIAAGGEQAGRRRLDDGHAVACGFRGCVRRARVGRGEVARHGGHDDDRRRGEPDLRSVRDQASDRATGARRPVTPRAEFALVAFLSSVPVEFLSDVEAAAYGRYDGGPSREELDRVFFLDDADRELVDRRRGEHNRLGFALQLTTVRWLGVFLPDPTDVPEVVLSYVAGQLGVSDPSCVGRYLERRPTRFDHAEEIKLACGLSEFAQARSEFEDWVAARAWMTGDGPRAIFADAVGWLRERDVLLPGVTTLARLVARARAEGDERLWETLAAVPTVEQARMLEGLLDLGEGSRFSDLERWRKGPGDPTGKSLRRALSRVAEIHGVGIDSSRVRALVPARRLLDLRVLHLSAVDLGCVSWVSEGRGGVSWLIR